MGLAGNLQKAGEMILSDEGGDFGQVLRRLYSHVVDLRRADIASGSGSVLEHLLVAACPQFSRELIAARLDSLSNCQT